MPFEVKVGDRQVLASGQLVLTPADREVTFTLEGMSYVMTFTPTTEPGPFQVSFNRRDQTHLHVDTRGLFPAGTIAWTYAGILQASDADIDLDLMVHSDSTAADSVRRIGFTFSARPKGFVAAEVDPVRSAPIRSSDSTPPPIPLPRT